jgi:hypothetical protein
MHGHNNKSLEVVRELGFEDVMSTSGPPTERVYFLGPCMGHCDREDGAHATVEAVLDFVAFWENQVQVAKDYLANGRNCKTHEWKEAKTEPSVEARVIVSELYRQMGFTDASIVTEARLTPVARMIDALAASRVATALKRR